MTDGPAALDDLGGRLDTPWASQTTAMRSLRRSICPRRPRSSANWSVATPSESSDPPPGEVSKPRWAMASHRSAWL